MKIIKYFSRMEAEEPYVCLENGEIYMLCITENGPTIVDNFGKPVEGKEMISLVGNVHLVKYIDFLKFADKIREA